MSAWALAAALLVLAPQASPPPSGGEVAVELVVEDGRGHLVRDLKSDEVLVFQDDVRQTIGSLQFSAERGWYELRYVPASGRVGAVSIRVSRGGSRLRGPDGPQLKPRWIAPIPAFEVPLRAALDLDPDAASSAGLAYEMAVLRFEARDDTLHHSVLAEIPFQGIAFARSGPRAQAHLAFLLRVKGEDGRIVHEGSLDQPLDVDGAGPGAVDVRRFVWSSHVHLRPGRYLVELVVNDFQGAKHGVRRTPLVVEPWPAGLRLSSLAFLFGLGGLMVGTNDDNPLRLEDHELVPMLRPTWVAGGAGAMSILALLYPDRRSSDPVTASIELHRDGQLRAKAPVRLPVAGPDGEIRYLGGLKFSSLQPGSYVVKMVAQQGAVRAEESAVLEVILTPIHRVE